MLSLSAGIEEHSPSPHRRVTGLRCSQRSAALSECIDIQAVPGTDERVSTELSTRCRTLEVMGRQELSDAAQSCIKIAANHQMNRKSNSHR